MILTHGANSLLHSSASDFLLLTYFEPDAQNHIKCVKGKVRTQPSTIYVTEQVATQFGTMNFARVGKVVFDCTDYKDYIKNNPIQIEIISKHQSAGGFMLYFIDQVVTMFMGELNSYGCILPFSSFLTTTLYNGVDSSYTYSGSSYTKVYYKNASGSTNFSNQYVHNAFVIDFPQKRMLMFHNGIITAKITLPNNYVEKYTSYDPVITIQDDNNTRTYSQLAVRPAIWTEERNYELPTEPYAK